MELQSDFQPADDLAPIETWSGFLDLVQILTRDKLSTTDLQQVLYQVKRLVEADSACIDACEPLSFPSLEIAEEEIPIQAQESFGLSYRLIAEGAPCFLSVRRKSRDFNHQERIIFQTACSLIVHSYKTRLQVQEERSERLLADSLRRFSEDLTSTFELEEILDLILDQLAMLIPYDSANILLLEDNVLQMHANRGYKNIARSKNLPGICFIPDSTVGSREVMASNNAIVLADTTQLNDWLWLPCGEHVRSWLGIPLLVKGKPIGIIQVDKSTPNFFTQKHVELATAMAVPAALAIDNARMLNQIREAKEQLRGLSSQVMQAQEQERSKLAVELHDHAGQALLGLRAELHILKRNLPATSSSALEQINILDEIIIELSRDLRQLALDLRPPILSELGLMAALEQYLDEYKRRLQIPIYFEIHPASGMKRLPADIELVCYRVIQEALTNLAKHAQAKSVKISFIVTSDHLNFSIQDDGIGLPRKLSGSKKRQGFGLLGMRERVLSVGGDLQVWSQPGRGTRIEVDIPLGQQ